MKKFVVIISAFVLAAGCASGVKKSASSDTGKVVTVAKVKPTPTPVRMVEDHSKVWRNSTDLPVALLPDKLWPRISNPEAWKKFNDEISEVTMVGAALRVGSQFAWTYHGKKVESEVTAYENEKKLVLKGTPFSPEAEIEFSLRQANATNSFLHFECRLLPGWKTKQKKDQLHFFREFSSALQKIK